MVGHGGSSTGSYLADPTSPIPSHCASIVVISTLIVNFWICVCVVNRVFTLQGISAAQGCDVCVHSFLLQRAPSVVQHLQPAIQKALCDPQPSVTAAAPDVYTQPVPLGMIKWVCYIHTSPWGRLKWPSSVAYSTHYQAAHNTLQRP